jgi:spore coat protein U-like protein
MKKLLTITAAAAVMAMAGNAMALGTANLTVQASIVAACSVDAPTALDFGVLDATIAGASKSTTTPVNVHCTKGTAPVLTATNPAMGNGTDTIAYTLTFPAVAASTGVTQVVTVTGDIAAGGFFMKSSGSYTNTAVITVNP